MKDSAEAKSVRLLTIYSRLVNGELLVKSELAEQHHVSNRSIQRDTESLRCFIANQFLAQDIIYDHQLRGYRLVSHLPKGLTNNEVLAVCKILLESRSMQKSEMLPILNKLIDCCVPAENRKMLHDLVANEALHYIEPHHKKSILGNLWDIGQAIQKRNVLEIDYEKLGSANTVHRVIEPVGLLFSEYYFYLAAFIRNIDKDTEFENSDDLFPTIYRIDRIRDFKVLAEHFNVPYRNRFEEGEFGKRVQFMYGGKLQSVRFRYVGPSIEAVLDRIPTAKVISESTDGYVIKAEVFGKGIEMWLRSQGDMVKEVCYE